jgi:hypothetical protein
MKNSGTEGPKLEKPVAECDHEPYQRYNVL